MSSLYSKDRLQSNSCIPALKETLVETRFKKIEAQMNHLETKFLVQEEFNQQMEQRHQQFMDILEKLHMQFDELRKEIKEICQVIQKSDLSESEKPPSIIVSSDTDASDESSISLPYEQAQRSQNQRSQNQSSDDISSQEPDCDSPMFFNKVPDDSSAHVQKKTARKELPRVPKSYASRKLPHVQKRIVEKQLPRVQKPTGMKQLRAQSTDSSNQAQEKSLDKQLSQVQEESLKKKDTREQFTKAGFEVSDDEFSEDEEGQQLATSYFGQIANATVFESCKDVDEDLEHLTEAIKAFADGAEDSSNEHGAQVSEQNNKGTQRESLLPRSSNVNLMPEKRIFSTVALFSENGVLGLGTLEVIESKQNRINLCFSLDFGFSKEFELLEGTKPEAIQGEEDKATWTSMHDSSILSADDGVYIAEFASVEDATQFLKLF